MLSRRQFLAVVAESAVAASCTGVPNSPAFNNIQSDRSTEPRESSIPLGRNARGLSILTWNIWMMPEWTFQSPHNAKRAAAIADEVSKLDLDIVCFEKVFDDVARHVLVTMLGNQFPYRYGPANNWSFSLLLNSGVWVLSRIPLNNYQEIEFDDSASWDSFARKGAMFLEGIYEGHPFQLIATHCQGDDTPLYRPDHQRVRDLQVDQLARQLLMPNARPGVPMFFCGDFSTPRCDPANQALESAGYRHLITTLGAENGTALRITLDDNLSHNDLATDNTGRTDEMDYILIRSNGSALESERDRLILRHGGWDRDGNRVDLAYRYAVRAAIHFG